MLKLSNLWIAALSLGVLATAQTASACDHFGYGYPHAAYRAVAVVAPAPVHFAYAAPVAVRLTEVEVAPGATVQLTGGAFGGELGAVLVRFDNQLILKADVKQWGPGAVTFKLPEAVVNGFVGAFIEVKTPNGQLAKVARVRFAAHPDLVVVHDNRAGELTVVSESRPAPKTEAPSTTGGTTPAADPVPPSPIASTTP